jgi:hypothetical protein
MLGENSGGGDSLRATLKPADSNLKQAGVRVPSLIFLFLSGYMSDIPISVISRHVTDSLHASLLDLRVPSANDSSVRGAAILKWSQSASSVLEQLLVASETALSTSTLGAALRAAETASSAERLEAGGYQAALNSVGNLAREVAWHAGRARAPVPRAIDVVVHGSFRGLPLAVDPAWAVAQSLLGDATRTLAQSALIAQAPLELPACGTSEQTIEDSDVIVRQELIRRAARQALEEAVQRAMPPCYIRKHFAPKLSLRKGHGTVSLALRNAFEASLTLLCGRNQWETWLVTDVLPLVEEGDANEGGGLWLAGGAHALESVVGLRGAAQMTSASAPLGFGLSAVSTLIVNIAIDVALESLFQQAAALAAAGAEAAYGITRLGTWTEGRLRARLLRTPRSLFLSAWPISSVPFRRNDAVGDILLRELEGAAARVSFPLSGLVAVDDGGIPHPIALAFDRLIASPAWSVLCRQEPWLGDPLIASEHFMGDEKADRQSRIADCGDGLVLTGDGPVALVMPADAFSAVPFSFASCAAGSAILCQLAAVVESGGNNSATLSQWPPRNPSFAAALTHICSSWVAGVGLDHNLALGTDAAQVTIEVVSRGAEARGRAAWYASALALRSPTDTTGRASSSSATSGDDEEAEPMLLWRNICAGEWNAAPMTLAEPSVEHIVAPALCNSALESLRLASTILSARADLRQSVSDVTLDVQMEPHASPSGVVNAILRVSGCRRGGRAREILSVCVNASSGDVLLRCDDGAIGTATARALAAVERRTQTALRERMTAIGEHLSSVEIAQRAVIDEGLLTSGIGNSDDDHTPRQMLDANALSHLSVRTGCLGIISRGNVDYCDTAEELRPNVSDVVAAAAAASLPLSDERENYDSDSALRVSATADPLAASRDYIAGVVGALAMQHVSDAAALLLAPSSTPLAIVSAAAADLANAASNRGPLRAARDAIDRLCSLESARALGPALAQVENMMNAAFPLSAVFEAAREAVDVLCYSLSPSLVAPSVSTALAGAVAAKVSTARAVIIAEAIAAALRVLVTACEVDDLHTQCGVTQNDERPRWLILPDTFADVDLCATFAVSSAVRQLALPKEAMSSSSPAAEAWLLVPRPCDAIESKAVLVVASRLIPRNCRLRLSWANAAAGRAAPPVLGSADSVVLAGSQEEPISAPAIWARAADVARANGGRDIFSLPAHEASSEKPRPASAHAILVDVSAIALVASAPAVCVKEGGPGYKHLHFGLRSLRDSAEAGGAVALVLLMSGSDAATANAARTSALAMSFLPLPHSRCPVILIVNPQAAAVVRASLLPASSGPSAQMAPVPPPAARPSNGNNAVRSLFGGRSIPLVGAARAAPAAIAPASSDPLSPVLHVQISIDPPPPASGSCPPAVLLALKPIELASVNRSCTAASGSKRGRDEALAPGDCLISTAETHARAIGLLLWGE